MARQPTARPDNLNLTSSTGQKRLARPSAITHQGTDDTCTAPDACGVDDSVGARDTTIQKKEGQQLPAGNTPKAATQKKESQQLLARATPKASAWVSAAAERLTLVTSLHNETGFKHVTRNLPDTNRNPFQLRIWDKGKVLNGGYYATADEAALAYARRIGPDASAAEANATLLHTMTASEALAAAAAEGLTLKKKPNGQGYYLVQFNAKAGGGGVRPYRVQVRSRGRSGRTVFSGVFATAEEAALHLARFEAKRAAEGSSLVRSDL